MNLQDQYYQARIQEIQGTKERRQELNKSIGDSILLLFGIAILLFIAPAIPWVIGAIAVYFVIKYTIKAITLTTNKISTTVTDSITNLFDFSDKSALIILDKVIAIAGIFILIIFIISYLNR